jgi:hypothetical protein
MSNKKNIEFMYHILGNKKCVYQCFQVRSVVSRGIVRDAKKLGIKYHTDCT